MDSKPAIPSHRIYTQSVVRYDPKWWHAVADEKEECMTHHMAAIQVAKKFQSGMRES